MGQQEGQRRRKNRRSNEGDERKAVDAERVDGELNVRSRKQKDEIQNGQGSEESKSS